MFPSILPSVLEVLVAELCVVIERCCKRTAGYTCSSVGVLSQIPRCSLARSVSGLRTKASDEGSFCRDAESVCGLGRCKFCGI